MFMWYDCESDTSRLRSIRCDKVSQLHRAHGSSLVNKHFGCVICSYFIHGLGFPGHFRTYHLPVLRCGTTSTLSQSQLSGLFLSNSFIFLPGKERNLIIVKRHIFFPAFFPLVICHVRNMQPTDCFLCPTNFICLVSFSWLLCPT